MWIKKTFWFLYSSGFLDVLSKALTKAVRLNEDEHMVVVVSSVKVKGEEAMENLLENLRLVKSAWVEPGGVLYLGNGEYLVIVGHYFGEFNKSEWEL